MYIRIEVNPGARKESVHKEEGKWQISVREKAEGNRANIRVRELVAQELSMPFNRVRILTGHHSRSKMISIVDP